MSIIGIASFLVQREHRREWRREWEAELYHFAQILEDRSAAQKPLSDHAELLRFAWGALPDAAALRLNEAGREQLVQDARKYAESPLFCIAALLALNLAVMGLSGFLPRTRDVTLPLPYPDPGRVATVSQGSVNLATRSGIPLAWTTLWQQENKLLDGVAAYRWKLERFAKADARSDDSSAVMTAVVSDSFFPLLGARTTQGDSLERSSVSQCGDCVYLSYAFWREKFAGGDGTEHLPASIRLADRSYRVAGILAKEFWFLSRDIAIWRGISAVDELKPSSYVGTVVRLRAQVAPQDAERELQSILQATHTPDWSTFVTVAPLQTRVRAVFGSFLLGLTLAVVMVVVAARLRLPSLWRTLMFRRDVDPAGSYGYTGALFFAAKTGMLLLAIFLAGVEFTYASSITMIGGADYFTEPLSMYLFLIVSACALTWSIADQRRRCRTCLRRLGLAASVGCPGCLLLNWAGTELVCVDGHGMLHVPEMSPSWQEGEKWTQLDSSWAGLFAKRIH
jgi:hypothetical protein